MPKDDRAPLAPEIANALAALDCLRAEQAEVDLSDLARMLPPLARRLVIHHQDVSVDALLEFARKGADHVQKQYETFSEPHKKQFKKSYAEIIARINPGHESQGVALYSRLESIKKRNVGELHFCEVRYDVCHTDNSLVMIGPDDAWYAENLASTAAERGDAYTLTKLMGLGLDKQRYDHLLVKAALYNHADAMRVLLDSGANPNVQSFSGSKVFPLIEHCGSLGMKTAVDLLHEYGAIISNDTLNKMMNYHFPNIVLELGAKGVDLSGLGAPEQKALARYKEWANALPEFSSQNMGLMEDVEISGHFTALDMKAKGARDVVAVSLMLNHEGHLNEMANMATNAIRLFGTEDRVLRYLDQWGKPGKQPLHDILYMITFPPNEEGMPAVPSDLKAWGDAVLQHGPEMAKLVKFSNRLGQPCRSDDGSCWSLTKTRNAIAELIYWRGREHPELAAMAQQVHWSEHNFNDALETVLQYQEQYAANDNQKPVGVIPAITIQGAAFNKDGYTFARLADGDIRGLALGDFTACCQHIGGFGDEYTKHGFLSPQAGFYAVTNNKTDQIVAQSWAWRGTKGELVLDSLEYLSGHMTGEQARTLCQIFAQEARKAGITQAIHIGSGGKTPAMGFKEARQPATPIDPVSHSDSTHQYVIAGPQ